MEICCVCGNSTSSFKNPIIKCVGKKCGITVHKVCYGLKDIPKSSWTCFQCQQYKRSLDQICVLCPIKEGAMKCIDNGSWCHIVCALFHPAVKIGNRRQMDQITLLTNKFSSDSGLRECYLCIRYGKDEESKKGRCIQCKANGCTQTFHVTCGQLAGLLVSMSQGKGVQFTAFCDTHSRKTRTRGFHIPEDFCDLPDLSDTLQRSSSQESKASMTQKRGTTNAESSSLSDSTSPKIPPTPPITPVKSTRALRKDSSSGKVEELEERRILITKPNVPVDKQSPTQNEEQHSSSLLSPLHNSVKDESFEEVLLVTPTYTDPERPRRGRDTGGSNVPAVGHNILLSNNSPPNLSPQQQSPPLIVQEDEDHGIREMDFLSPHNAGLDISLHEEEKPLKSTNLEETTLSAAAGNTRTPLTTPLSATTTPATPTSSCAGASQKKTTPISCQNRKRPRPAKKTKSEGGLVKGKKAATSLVSQTSESVETNGFTVNPKPTLPFTAPTVHMSDTSPNPINGTCSNHQTTNLLQFTPPPNGMRIRGWNAKTELTSTIEGGFDPAEEVPDPSLTSAYKGMEQLLDWQWDQTGVLCMQLAADVANNSPLASSSTRSDVITLLNSLHHVKRENETLVHRLLDLDAKKRLLKEKNEKLSQLMQEFANAPALPNTTSSTTSTRTVIPPSASHTSTSLSVAVPSNLSETHSVSPTKVFVNEVALVNAHAVLPASSSNKHAAPVINTSGSTSGHHSQPRVATNGINKHHNHHHSSQQSPQQHPHLQLNQHQQQHHHPHHHPHQHHHSTPHVMVSPQMQHPQPTTPRLTPHQYIAAKPTSWHMHGAAPLVHSTSPYTSPTFSSSTHSVSTTGSGQNPYL